jgi:hypothetical protein
MGSEQLTPGGPGRPCTVLLGFLVSDAIQENYRSLVATKRLGSTGQKPESRFIALY